MRWSANDSGLFSLLTLDSAASADGSRERAIDGGRGGITTNEFCSFRAASRIEQFSIADTKSRTLPPIRPPRAATQESEWQAQAFFWVLTIKLWRLLFEV